jgi:hypothetical protein
LEKHPDQLVHAILGSNELLLFDVDRVITSIDSEKGTFTWVSKRSILQDLQLTEDQFLDMCILAGCDYCSTFPILTLEPSVFHFKSVYDMIRYYRTGDNVVNYFIGHPEIIRTKYDDIYCRVHSVIRHHLVLTDDGIVRPLSLENVPKQVD